MYIALNGWDREYNLNKEAYQGIFNRAMAEPNIEIVERLERRISNYTGRYAVAVASCTDALHFSLLAANIKGGDEVLVTNFSWIATSSVISMVGATPVFCDIDVDTYHMSLDSIKRMCSDKTKAIIYPHLFGNMVDISDIITFCREKNIILIEDAAQALGSSLDGKKAGTIGDMACFSFAHNKVIAGINGGGVFLTSDRLIADHVKMLRRHGRGNYLGRNSKMYLLNCEIINYRFDNMEKRQLERQEIANRFEDDFRDLPIVTQSHADGLNHNYHKYVVRFDNQETRDFATEQLKNVGIESQIHYDKLLSDNEMYKGISHRKDNCTNSVKVSSTILSIPCHSWLKEEEQLKISNMITMLA